MIAPSNYLEKIQQRLGALSGGENLQLLTVGMPGAGNTDFLELHHNGQPLIDFQMRRDPVFGTLFFQAPGSGLQKVRTDPGVSQEHRVADLLHVLANKAIGAGAGKEGWNPSRASAFLQQEVGYVGGSYLDPRTEHSSAMRARVASERNFPAAQADDENMDRLPFGLVARSRGLLPGGSYQPTDSHLYARKQDAAYGPQIEPVFSHLHGGGAKWNPKTGEIEVLSWRPGDEGIKTIKHAQKAGLQDVARWTDPTTNELVAPIRPSLFSHAGPSGTDGEWARTRDSGQVVRIAFGAGLPEGQGVYLQDWNIRQQRLAQVQGRRNSLSGALADRLNTESDLTPGSQPGWYRGRGTEIPGLGANTGDWDAAHVRLNEIDVRTSYRRDLAQVPVDLYASASGSSAIGAYGLKGMMHQGSAAQYNAPRGAQMLLNFNSIKDQLAWSESLVNGVVYDWADKGTPVRASLKRLGIKSLDFGKAADSVMAAARQITGMSEFWEGDRFVAPHLEHPSRSGAYSWGGGGGGAPGMSAEDVLRLKRAAPEWYDHLQATHGLSKKSVFAEFIRTGIVMYNRMTGDARADLNAPGRGGVGSAFTVGAYERAGLRSEVLTGDEEPGRPDYEKLLKGLGEVVGDQTDRPLEMNVDYRGKSVNLRMQSLRNLKFLTGQMWNQPLGTDAREGEHESLWTGHTTSQLRILYHALAGKKPLEEDIQSYLGSAQQMALSKQIHKSMLSREIYGAAGGPIFGFDADKAKHLEYSLIASDESLRKFSGLSEDRWSPEHLSAMQEMLETEQVPIAAFRYPHASEQQMAMFLRLRPLKGHEDEVGITKSPHRFGVSTTVQSLVEGDFDLDPDWAAIPQDQEGGPIEWGRDRTGKLRAHYVGGYQPSTREMFQGQVRAMQQVKLGSEELSKWREEMGEFDTRTKAQGWLTKKLSQAPTWVSPAGLQQAYGRNLTFGGLMGRAYNWARQSNFLTDMQEKFSRPLIKLYQNMLDKTMPSLEAKKAIQLQGGLQPSTTGFGPFEGIRGGTFGGMRDAAMAALVGNLFGASELPDKKFLIKLLNPAKDKLRDVAKGLLRGKPNWAVQAALGEHSFEEAASNPVTAAVRGDWTRRWQLINDAGFIKGEEKGPQDAPWDRLGTSIHNLIAVVSGKHADIPAMLEHYEGSALSDKQGEYLRPIMALTGMASPENLNDLKEEAGISSFSEGWSGTANKEFAANISWGEARLLESVRQKPKWQARAIHAALSANPRYTPSGGTGAPSFDDTGPTPGPAGGWGDASEPGSPGWLDSISSLQRSGWYAAMQPAHPEAAAFAGLTPEHQRTILAGIRATYRSRMVPTPHEIITLHKRLRPSGGPTPVSPGAGAGGAGAGGPGAPPPAAPDYGTDPDSGARRRMDPAAHMLGEQVVRAARQFIVSSQMSHRSRTLGLSSERAAQVAGFIDPGQWMSTEAQEFLASDAGEFVGSNHPLTEGMEKLEQFESGDNTRLGQGSLRRHASVIKEFARAQRGKVSPALAAKYDLLEGRARAMESAVKGPRASWAGQAASYNEATGSYDFSAPATAAGGSAGLPTDLVATLAHANTAFQNLNRTVIKSTENFAKMSIEEKAAFTARQGLAGTYDRAASLIQGATSKGMPAPGTPGFRDIQNAEAQIKLADVQYAKLDGASGLTGVNKLVGEGGIGGFTEKLLGGFKLFYLNRLKNIATESAQETTRAFIGQQMSTTQGLFQTGQDGGLTTASTGFLTQRAITARSQANLGSSSYATWAPYMNMGAGGVGNIAASLGINVGLPALSFALAGGAIGSAAESGSLLAGLAAPAAFPIMLAGATAGFGLNWLRGQTSKENSVGRLTAMMNGQTGTSIPSRLSNQIGSMWNQMMAAPTPGQLEEGMRLEAMLGNYPMEGGRRVGQLGGDARTAFVQGVAAQYFPTLDPEQAAAFLPKIWQYGSLGLGTQQKLGYQFSMGADPFAVSQRVAAGQGISPYNFVAQTGTLAQLGNMDVPAQNALGGVYAQYERTIRAMRLQGRPDQITSYLGGPVQPGQMGPAVNVSSAFADFAVRAPDQADWYAQMLDVNEQRRAAGMSLLPVPSYSSLSGMPGAGQMAQLREGAARTNLAQGFYGTALQMGLGTGAGVGLQNLAATGDQGIFQANMISAAAQGPGNQLSYLVASGQAAGLNIPRFNMPGGVNYLRTQQTGGRAGLGGLGVGTTSLYDPSGALAAQYAPIMAAAAGTAGYGAAMGGFGGLNAVQRSGYGSDQVGGGLWALADLQSNKSYEFRQRGQAIQAQQLSLNWAQEAYGGGQAGYFGMQGGPRTVQSQWAIQDQQMALQRAQQGWGLQYGQMQMNLGVAQFGQTQGFNLMAAGVGFAQQQTNFGLQGRGMALNRAQQLQQFGFQGEQLGLSRGNELQNFGLQREGMLLGRTFQAENFALQGRSTAASFGFQMRDIDIAIRRSTGFERQQLERQKEETVSGHNFDVEGRKLAMDQARRQWAEDDKRFNVAKGQSAALYDLELRRFEAAKANADAEYALQQDQFKNAQAQAQENYDIQLKRFEMEASQFKARTALEQSNHDKQVTWFAEQVTLEDANRDNQRTFATQQHDLAVKNLALQTDELDTMKQISDLQTAIERANLTQQATLKFLYDTSFDWAKTMSNWIAQLTAQLSGGEGVTDPHADQHWEPGLGWVDNVVRQTGDGSPHAAGFMGMVHRGSTLSISEQGGEDVFVSVRPFAMPRLPGSSRVTSSAGMSTGSGGDTVVHVYLDGKEISAQTVKRIAQETYRGRKL